MNLKVPIIYTTTASSLRVSVTVAGSAYEIEVPIINRDPEEQLVIAIENLLEQVRKDYPKTYLSRPTHLLIV